MRKSIPGIILAAALSLSLALPALASPAGAVDEAEAAQVLAALGIMAGDPDGDLRLEDHITRAELVTMAIMASPYADSVGDTAGVKPYPDVPREEWFAPFVVLARDKGLIGGYTDGTFRPDNDITLAETATVVLNLLGYQSTDFSGLWPSGQMAAFRALKLDAGVVTAQNDPIIRRDALYIFYDLLTAKNKMGQVYLTTLGHTLTSAGEIDKVALIRSSMEGPILARDGWQARLGFSLDHATVYRAGKLSAPEALQRDDVIYWSRSMRTLWAYTGQATGLYQAAAPSASDPRTVTVAGRSYSVETAEAAYDLSDLGRFRLGDTVTLLLGRDGGVAAVRAPDEGAEVLCGLLTSVADSTHTDADGSQYTARTATLLATDGSLYTYPLEPSSHWSAGSLVQVTAVNGELRLTALSSSASVSGKVDAAGTRLGGTPFADDVEILDTSEAQAVSLRPTRLAGASLDREDIRYCRLNAAGEIDRLILNNFTGDMLSYGVVTSVSESSTPSLIPGGLPSLSGTYVYDVGGVSYTYVFRNGQLQLDKGPAVITGPLPSPTALKNISTVELASLGTSSAVSKGGLTYPLWDKAVFYELDDGVYRLSTPERVAGRRLVGCWDKPVADGGALRIVIGW